MRLKNDMRYKAYNLYASYQKLNSNNKNAETNKISEHFT